ncbi:MAG: hypothetical protein WB676_10970 [Bryobacteraceae bacterium]
MFKSRTHAITFRLAESEYQELKETALSQGARSISEFARAAVLKNVGLPAGASASEEDLSSLNLRLEVFELALRDVRGRILQMLSTRANSASGKT